MKDNRKDKYTDFGEMAQFGYLVNMTGGGGDRNQLFPQSDAEDFSRGLRFVPGEVTLARRRGEQVAFVQSCSNPCCWYWQFKDKSRTYYFESWAFDEMKQKGLNKCPQCGNKHIRGGHVK